MSSPELGLTGKGAERVCVKAVDAAVESYVAVRDERMDLTKKEVEKKQALVAALRANVDKIGADKDGTIVYRHDDMLVTLRHGKDELKVTTKGEDENGDD